MSNIEVYAPLVDGSMFPFHEKGESCKFLIEEILGDDLRPPPRRLTIKIKTSSGKDVIINIPNDHSEATVNINGESI